MKTERVFADGGSLEWSAYSPEKYSCSRGRMAECAQTMGGSGQTKMHDCGCSGRRRAGCGKGGVATSSLPASAAAPAIAVSAAVSSCSSGPDRRTLRALVLPAAEPRVARLPRHEEADRDEGIPGGGRGFQ